MHIEPSQGHRGTRCDGPRFSWTSLLSHVSWSGESLACWTSMSICKGHLLAGIGRDRWVLGLLVEDGVGFCVEVALASQMLLITYLVIAAVPERGTQMVQALVVEVDVAE